MDRRDIEEVERFLTSVGKPTLFAYYDLDPACDAAAADEAVRKRRTWAQGQQSNPKYRPEALFLIKSNALLRRVFFEQLDAYRAHVRSGARVTGLDGLGTFIRATIGTGGLTPQGEAAILQQGRQLDLADAAIVRAIDAILAETGARRVGFELEDLSTEAIAIDHYTILGVPPDATPAVVEEAYRSRYRWARNLKDLKRSAAVLQSLDEAWRILSEPRRRALYDARRLEISDVTDEVERHTALLLGLLGAPSDEDGTLPGLPPPRAATPTPAPIGAPPGAAPVIALPVGAPPIVAPDIGSPVPPPHVEPPVASAPRPPVEAPRVLAASAPPVPFTPRASTDRPTHRTERGELAADRPPGPPRRSRARPDWILVGVGALAVGCIALGVIAASIALLRPWDTSPRTTVEAPTAGASSAATPAPPDEALQAALEAAGPLLAPCFAAADAGEARATYTLHVNAETQLIEVEIRDATFAVAPHEACIRTTLSRLPVQGASGSAEARLTVPR